MAVTPKIFSSATFVDATKPPSIEAKKTTDGPSFGDLLSDKGSDVVSAVKNMDKAANMAAEGKIQTEDLAAIVKEAELVLMEVNTIRDKVVQGLSEILKSPV